MNDLNFNLETMSVPMDQSQDLAADAFYRRAFSRNLGLVSENEMNQLRHTRVAIPGLGGVGGVHLLTLVRMGIGNFHLADLDTFEEANFNRQAGAKISSLGQKKLDVMVNEALDINPFLSIKKFPKGISENNLDEFLDGVDVVVDGLDAFVIGLRRKLFNRARQRGIPVITAGPMGFSSALLVFTPDGMSFDQYFDIQDGMSELEQLLAFFTGLSPRLPHIKYMDRKQINLALHRGPSMGLACQLCAGMASPEVLRWVTKREEVKAAPHYFTFDPYLRRYYQGKLWFGNGSLWRRLLRKLAYWVITRKK